MTTVGNNVWFGGGVRVLHGVLIGDNAVIGVGSAAVHDIPANAVAVGNPCCAVRQLMQAHTQLCRIPEYINKLEGYPLWVAEKSMVIPGCQHQDHFAAHR